MFAQERHSAIKKIVREKRRLTFAQLQAAVKASPATLRRDLTELEASGDLLRVHGGILDPAYVRAEISFDDRLLRNHPAKKSIAAKATSLIPPGSSVFVDAGSTCLQAGNLLLRRRDVRIISHSGTLAAAALHGEADFLCLGGELRRVSGAYIGGAAIGALASLRADVALIGASGLDWEGCSTTEVTEAEMKRVVLGRCSRNVVLADSSKWNNPSTINFTPWSAIQEWITDGPLSPKERLRFRDLGVTVHSVNPSA